MTIFYTGKGDAGTTTLFGNKDRVSKDSAIFDALGTIDELNSWVGLIVSAVESHDTLVKIQNHLFIIQAQLAGAPKKIKKKHLKFLDDTIATMQKEAKLKQNSFILPGGTNGSALYDVARTITRRAERAVVSTNKVDQNTLAYLNRLSSFFYVVARFVNKTSGVEEKIPNYDEA